jgi:transcriptional regulator with XRE-family HTH domain
MSTSLRRAGTPVELGAALARIRQSAELRQEDLALRAGLRREYVSRLESGQATEQLRALFRVLRALGYELAITERER